MKQNQALCNQATLTSNVTLTEEPIENSDVDEASSESLGSELHGRKKDETIKITLFAQFDLYKHS